MEKKIELSILPYFTQGNTMIGSCTPDDYVGELLAKIFNYRVSYVKTKDEEKSEEYLEALYFIDNKCYELTDKSKVVSEKFEPSDEGIEAASKWLLNEYNKYLRTV